MIEAPKITISSQAAGSVVLNAQKSHEGNEGNDGNDGNDGHEAVIPVTEVSTEPCSTAATKTWQRATVVADAQTKERGSGCTPDGQ